MITEGPDEGCQIIVIRPAKPFNLMGLTSEIRCMIFEYYFANKGLVGEPINLDGKRKGLLNDIYAKAYSNDSKNRVGLLAVNKEVTTLPQLELTQSTTNLLLRSTPKQSQSSTQSQSASKAQPP